MVYKSGKSATVHYGSLGIGKNIKEVWIDKETGGGTLGSHFANALECIRAKVLIYREDEGEVALMARTRNKLEKSSWCRTNENQKIACCRKHFGTLGVDYDVTKLKEVES